MPVAMKKVGNKIRIVEAKTGRISKADTGGYPNTAAGKRRARAKVQAVNLSIRKKR